MTCDPKLIHLFERVLECGYDHTILVGHRDQAEQHHAFVTGKSQIDWPNGNHNKVPSNAVDVSPFIDGEVVMPKSMHALLNRFRASYATSEEVDKMFDQYRQLCHFAGYVQGIAKILNISIRWGGDWNKNFSVFDNNFDDLFHFELRPE
jgi:peptidoglycan L-alanyl-D-glutamate endopeptidase CwlK